LAAAAAAGLISQAVVWFTTMNDLLTLVTAGLLGALVGGAVASVSSAWRQDVRSVLPLRRRSVSPSTP
jgi:fructose-specific phosphotransferase system IIC component